MKRLLIGFVCFFVAVQGMAQYAPADVASAEGLFKSNLYTGSPDVSIPIYNFVSRDISVPLVLYYTGGNGLLVNNEASWVGLGWHLQCGGFISQHIRGYSDFHYDGGYITHPIKLPCLTGTSSIPSVDCWGNATNVPNYDALDLEPDIFALSIAGYKVKFFFDKTGRIFQTEQTDLEIKYLGIESGFKFTAKTPEGYTYTFSPLGQSYDYGNPNQKFQDQGSTWYLMSISSLRSGETVWFDYQYDPQLMDAKKAIKVESELNDDGATEPSRFLIGGDPARSTTSCQICFEGTIRHAFCPSDACALLSPNNSRVDRVITISSNTVILTKIRGSLGYIDFVTGPRTDVGSNEAKLTDIKAYGYKETVNDVTLLHHRRFYHSYFMSDPDETPPGYFKYPYPGKNGLRLRLDSIRQVSGNLFLPPHAFFYEQTINLPFKTSYDIDHWGYNNRDFKEYSVINWKLLDYRVSNPPRVLGRESIGIKASANMIKKVVEPLGRTTEFTYDSSGAGVRVGTIKISDGASPAKTIKYEYTVGKINKPAYYHGNIYFYPVLGFGCTSFYGYWIDPSSKFICPYLFYSSKLPGSFSDLTSFVPINYTKIIEYDGENGKTEHHFSLINYNTLSYPFVPITKNCMDGRLTKRIHFKKVGNIFKKTIEQSFSYTFRNSLGPYMNNFSSNITRPTTSNGMKAFVNYAGEKTDYLGYVMQVIELSSITTTTKTFDQNDESKFVSTIDSAANHPVDFLPYISTNQTLGTGILTTKNFRHVKHVAENTTYATPPNSELATTPSKLLMQVLTLKHALPSYDLLEATSEFLRYDASGNLKERWVNNGGPVIAPYNQNGLPVFDSKYRQILKNTYSGGNLVQQDAVLKENKTNGYNATFTSTSTIWGYRNSLPIAVANNADLSQIAYNGFETATLPGATGWSDGSGGISLVDKTAEPSNVFMGNFSLKIPPSGSGSPVFSPNIVIKPASQNGKYKFSCWVKLASAMAQDNVYIEIKSIQSAVFGSARFPDIAKAHIVKNPNRTVTDWQYVEAIIDLDYLKTPNPAIDLYLSVVVFSTNVGIPIYIDELRLHPLDAQMTTYAHRPGVGKLSESGPDSKPVHYEYDAFNRLLHVRDFRGNILKKNQYLTR